MDSNEYSKSSFNVDHRFLEMVTLSERCTAGLQIALFPSTLFCSNNYEKKTGFVVHSLCKVPVSKNL